MAASAERLSADNRPPPCRPPLSSRHVALTDALELLLLLRDSDPDRYPRAALRWHARYCREVPGVTLNEAAAILALLAALAEEADKGASGALAELFRARELDQPARILVRWTDRETRGPPKGGP